MEGMFRRKWWFYGVSVAIDVVMAVAVAVAFVDYIRLQDSSRQQTHRSVVRRVMEKTR